MGENSDSIEIFMTTITNPVLLPMIRKQLPILMAQSIIGVQPMTGPVEGLFIMKYTHTPQSKYKFTRANWYVAEFDIKDYTDVVHWCREQFGPHPRNPDAWSRWEHRYENKIHFRDKEDYIMFVLRWGV